VYIPRIVGFTCQWSLPEEASAANNSQFHGYPRIRLVQIACVGRLDPLIVLESFAEGADGVLIIGCSPLDCHYGQGNSQAEYTVKISKKLIALTGLELERVKLLWYESSAKDIFGRQVRAFSEEIAKLGPCPLKNEPKGKLMINIQAAKNTASEFRLRVLLGREKELTENVNAYGERIPLEKFTKLLDDVVEAEFVRHKICVLMKTKPMSVKTIAKVTEVKSEIVLRQIVNLRRRNMIALHHVEGTTPFFKALEA